MNTEAFNPPEPGETIDPGDDRSWVRSLAAVVLVAGLGIGWHIWKRPERPEQITITGNQFGSAELTLDDKNALQVYMHSGCSGAAGIEDIKGQAYITCDGKPVWPVGDAGTVAVYGHPADPNTPFPEPPR